MKRKKVFFNIKNFPRDAGLLVLQIILNGVILAVIWNWLGVPILKFPKINPIQAWAIYILIHAFITGDLPKRDNLPKNFVEYVMSKLFILTLAFTIKFFI